MKYLMLLLLLLQVACSSIPEKITDEDRKALDRRFPIQHSKY